jgi:malonyl-CoA/methylmalonyl-CoA synthetase
MQCRAGEPNVNRTTPLNLYSVYRSRFASMDAVLLTTESGATYTYGDAERCSAQIANYLNQLGLRQGDRVTVQVEKSVEALFLYLGTIRAGLVFHPLNPAYTDEELLFFLNDASPRLVVCDSRRERKLQDMCQALGSVHLRTLDADGTGTLMQCVHGCSDDFATAQTSSTDLAALVYSSGTTGKPKGIMLSHGNLVENVSVLVDYWGFSRNDCLLHALPIFHVHGLFVAIGCVLMSGSKMLWINGFEVATVLTNLPQCTVMMGVPTYYTRLLAEPGFSAQSCRTVRLFISGSAPLLADTFAEFERRTGHRILERYGMTETGMNTSNPLHGARRAGTVGLPLPGVEVRVCGVDDKALTVNEVGELQVRGSNVFAGYWNLPEQSVRDFTADGFFKTGDLAVVDEQGYVSIVGRAKDLVISGGLNVYPREIELLLNEIPGVKESAVIGLPDPDFGEIVVALVVPTEGVAPTEEGIREAIKDRVARFKLPKKILFIDELPRNSMGKVRKDLLRKRYSTA